MNKNTVRVELVRQFYRKNHCALFAAMTASILSGTVGLICSWILKQFIDLIAGTCSFTMNQLLLISGGFLAFLLLLTVLSCSAEPHFIRRAMKQYKDMIFSLLSGKNIASFREENTSAYLSALTNDATAVEANYVSQLLPIASKAVTFFGALIMMLVSSPALTGFAIAVMLIPTVVSVVMSKKMEKVQKDVSDKSADFTAAVTDCLGGFQVIK